MLKACAQLWCLCFSSPVSSLLCLAYGTLREALVSSPDGAIHLCTSVNHMFELFHDLIPSYHKDQLRNVPLLAGQFKQRDKKNLVKYFWRPSKP